ncbi:hypothetical protein ABPG75_008866 [Micractinium tetrahymenae]
MQALEDPPLPEELQHVPRDVLEAYVVARLRSHIRARGQALGLPPETVQALLGGDEVAPEGGGAAAPPSPARRGGSSGPSPNAAPASSSGSRGERQGAATGAAGAAAAPASKTLVFFHDCQRLGCADAACTLCANNPQRKCGADFFQHKYFQGSPLVAACGAPLCVAVCNAADGVPVSPAELPPGAQLEMFLLNNRLYEQEGAGPDPGTDRLHAAQLLRNAKGSHLLLCSSGPGVEQLPSGVVHAALGGSSTVQLPELRVDGSSEGLLGSKLWGYRLAVRVVDACGAPLHSIQPALSPQFIVTTTRVKGNVKPTVPLTTDPVGKLSGIGDRMAGKLGQAGEILAGLEGLAIPQGGAITTVGEYRTLVLSVEGQPKLCDRLIAALGLQKGWPEARQHALSAVQPDFLVRVWWADPHLTSGLLFSANLGTPQLQQPIAIGNSAEGGTLAVTSLAGAPTPADVQMWRQQAHACWVLPGHPGWGMLAVEGHTLESALVEGAGQALLPAELVQPCRQAVAARLAAMPPPEQLIPQALPGLPLEAAAAMAQGAMPAGAAAPMAPPPAGPAASPCAAAPPAAQPLPPAALPAVPTLDQEALPSPYETAMRLPSLPLLGKEPFGSLPKARRGAWRERGEVQAMESLSRLLFSDASLLPALGQLAERKAAAGEGVGGGGGAGEEQPSILMQLLMSLEQHHMAGEAGVPAEMAAAAAATPPDSPFDPAGLPDQPSWIPAGLFSLREGSGDAMAISRHTSKERQQGGGGRGGRAAAGHGGGGGGAHGSGQGVQLEEPPEHLLASMSLDK